MGEGVAWFYSGRALFCVRAGHLWSLFFQMCLREGKLGLFGREIGLIHEVLPLWECPEKAKVYL